MHAPRQPIALSAALAACILLVACGNSASDAPPDSHGTGPYRSVEGDKGGSLTVYAAGDPYGPLDPAMSRRDYGFATPRLPGVRALYGWAPGDESPRPDLASGPPVLSANRMSATIGIRDDVRYSLPVSRTIQARDFKYAITRGAMPFASNDYFDDVFGTLDGAADVEAGRATAIAGLQTPDAHTLVMRFTAPYPGVEALQDALSLPLAAPVPPEYARKFDRGDKSTYGAHMVFTGPYMIPNGFNGKLTGYQPGRRITFARNPSWDKHHDFRPAYADRIEIILNGKPKDVVRAVADGQSAVGLGLTRGELRSVQLTADGRATAVPTGAVHWTSPGARSPRADMLNVRSSNVTGPVARLSGSWALEWLSLEAPTA